MLLRIARLISSLVLCLILVVWYVDQRRGAAFAEVTLDQCNSSGCDTDKDIFVTQYKDTLGGGFDPWGATDFCAASIEILHSTAQNNRARLVPDSLALRDVLALQQADNIVTVAPGPALTNPLAPFLNLLTGKDTVSCHMSSYSPWIYLAFLVTLVSWGWPSRRKHETGSN